MSMFWLIVIIWAACSVVTLLALGLMELLMFDGHLSYHYSRKLRIAMVVFGPLSILYFIFTKVPVVNLFWHTLYNVLIRK